jgi:hypothetical protein
MIDIKYLTLLALSASKIALGQGTFHGVQYPGKSAPGVLCLSLLILLQPAANVWVWHTNLVRTRLDVRITCLRYTVPPAHP